jgi:hypothetical protein
MVRCSTLLLGSIGISGAMAQSYKIAKRYVGQSFVDEFGKPRDRVLRKKRS